jgi:hypothetical protein
MNKPEFAAIVAFLEAGCGKKLDDPAFQVYFGLLSDLPLPALQAAAQRCLLENEYPVFPPVGKLRRLATESMTPARLLPAEAWELVRTAIRRFGYCKEREGLESLSPEVRRAVECLGWQDLCDSTETEIVRAQFVKAYDSIESRTKQERLLPHTLQGQIAALAETVTLPAGLDYKRSTD